MILHESSTWHGHLVMLCNASRTQYGWRTLQSVRRQHVQQTRAAAWWATLQPPLHQRKGRLALQGPVLKSGN